MTMYRATAEGDVPLTAEEEAAVIAERGEWNSIDNQRKLMKVKVTRKRQQVELRGISVEGIPIATDDYAHSRVIKAVEFVKQTGQPSINFKGADGIFYEISAAQLSSILLAIGTFISSCYAAEAVHYAAIESLLDLTDYDVASGWPE